MDIEFVDTETKRKEVQQIRAAVIREIRQVCGNCKKLTKLERERYWLPGKRVRGK